VPSCVVPGSSYLVSGTQLNGLSQGAAYGDDVQGATNYPLVQIVNNSSGNVFYARTSGFSTMSIAPGQAGRRTSLWRRRPHSAPATCMSLPTASLCGQAVTVSNSCASQQPTLQVTPASNISSTGQEGGPFSPTSFSYMLSASSGSLGYSISGVPSWLTARRHWHSDDVEKDRDLHGQFHREIPHIVKLHQHQLQQHDQQSRKHQPRCDDQRHPEAIHHQGQRLTRV